MNKLLLIDGNSLINRAYYALRLIPNSNGVYTNAVSGFFKSLMKLKRSHSPDCIAVAFDLPAPTFRHTLYDGYKKTRKGMPDELAMQLPYIKKLLDLSGIKRAEIAGFEADDIIGTLAAAADRESIQCRIATGDRDAFQLVSDNVHVCLATAKGEVVYTPDTIREVYGIRPTHFIDIKSLMGDSSDNIPGIAGVGEKTAFSLVQEYGSIENIYDNIDGISESLRLKLQQGKADCLMSRELGRIATNVPVETSIAAYALGKPDFAGLTALLTELECTALLERLTADNAHLQCEQLSLI
jgi:DNA polymerase-1